MSDVESVRLAYRSLSAIPTDRVWRYQSPEPTKRGFVAGWYEYCDELVALIRALSALGSECSAGSRSDPGRESVSLPSPDAVAMASERELCGWAAQLSRRERFDEGLWATVYDSGVLLAVCGRLIRQRP